MFPFPSSKRLCFWIYHDLYMHQPCCWRAGPPTQFDSDIDRVWPFYHHFCHPPALIISRYPTLQCSRKDKKIVLVSLDQLYHTESNHLLTVDLFHDEQASVSLQPLSVSYQALLSHTAANIALFFTSSLFLHIYLFFKPFFVFLLNAFLTFHGQT